MNAYAIDLFQIRKRANCKSLERDRIVTSED